MEQNTQSQQSISLTPKAGKNKIIIAVFVTTVIVGAIVYFWTTNNSNRIKEKQIVQTRNQSVSSFDNDGAFAKINPKDYSLEEYSLKYSPIYNQTGKQCRDDSYYQYEQDARIINNDKIIIPSLIQLISIREGLKPDCGIFSTFGIFSAPADGKYLYLKIHPFTYKEGVPDHIYRLDLSNLLIEDLVAINNDVWGEYDLLSDGKRVIKWNDNTVYLVNLETDSVSALYTVPKDQWLIASIHDDEVLGVATFDIKVEKNQVTIGVFDKNKFQSSKTKDGLIKNYTLIDRITIPIPAN